MELELKNSHEIDLDFTFSGSEYVLDYKTKPKGTNKKVDFNIVGKELSKTAVTCGCTSAEDITKTSFSINYNINRTGSINQVVTLTFKDGSTAKIRLSGYVTS